MMFYYAAPLLKNTNYEGCVQEVKGRTVLLQAEEVFFKSRTTFLGHDVTSEGV